MNQKKTSLCRGLIVFSSVPIYPDSSIREKYNITLSICCYTLIFVRRYRNRIEVLVDLVEDIHTFPILKQPNLRCLYGSCNDIVILAVLKKIYSKAHELTIDLCGP